MHECRNVHQQFPPMCSHNCCWTNLCLYASSSSSWTLPSCHSLTAPCSLCRSRTLVPFSGLKQLYAPVLSLFPSLCETEARGRVRVQLSINKRHTVTEISPHCHQLYQAAGGLLKLWHHGYGKGIGWLAFIGKCIIIAYIPIKLIDICFLLIFLHFFCSFMVTIAKIHHANKKGFSSIYSQWLMSKIITRDYYVLIQNIIIKTNIGSNLALLEQFVTNWSTAICRDYFLIFKT